MTWILGSVPGVEPMLCCPHAVLPSGPSTAPAVNLYDPLMNEILTSRFRTLLFLTLIPQRVTPLP